MSGSAPALRFLVVVLGGWIVLRAATFVYWQGDVVISDGARHSPRVTAQNENTGRPVQIAVIARIADNFGTAPVAQQRHPVRISPTIEQQLAARRPANAPLALAATPERILATMDGARLPPELAGPVSRAPQRIARWTASAWMFVRGKAESSPLAPGGTLGGSQAGGRIMYRIGRDGGPLVRLSARAYLPLRRATGAEAAIGVDWQPTSLPLHLLAERRQAVGDEGRSAFSLIIYGGGSVALPMDLRLDGYAQAGVVGLRSRDMFIDGAVHVRRAIGPVEIGGAAWGAAQPGATRLDVGPQISLPLRAGPATLRVSADWRVRVAGNAMPGSGPALTLGADF